MNRLRNRLILIFVVATAVPLGITLWITTSLLDRSLRLASTAELDEMSRSLETTGRALYQRTREALRQDIDSGRLKPESTLPSAEAPEGFITEGDRLRYYERRGDTTFVYSRPIGASLAEISRQYKEARALVERARARDLRRGFFITVLVLGGGVWGVSMVLLIYWAHRISKPIHALTGGLAQLAEGNLDVRLSPAGNDEVGLAMLAFNNTAEQLKQNRDRLVYLTRLASWQTLARKMAHEVKNSLTPIRLTMEELTARGAGDPFIEQAAAIVIDEVGTLERRVRAFSEFASEPPVRSKPVDLNAAVSERISLLRNAHPDVIYNTRLAPGGPIALGDEDLIKSVLTNLLENAAEAAGSGGVVLTSTSAGADSVAVEVHDSGPGLSRHARESLFQPTISFKKTGMGLGLSIARRSALLCGGDIVLIEGELGGAAFRFTLKAAPAAAVASREQCLRSAS
ncbi:MAG TPA: ATP-binding protein [Bryobacteraceae bacterium]|nr:ATP-binding protein [Bryobacteraceae bacterium]